MKNKTGLKIVILFLIVLFFCLLCSILFIMNQYLNEEKAKIAVTEEPQTVQESLERENAKYLKEEDNKIYLEFEKDLYEPNGNSNEKYFTDLVENVKKFYEKKSFNLIDKTRNINIYVKYIEDDDYYSTIINGVENYFEKVDSELYSDIDSEPSVSKKAVMFTSNDYLDTLVAGEMQLRYIEGYLGEGEELESGYTSYLDNSIFIKKTVQNELKNIIFSDKYDDEVVKNVNLKKSLSEILKLYPDNSFGSLKDDYLGYITYNYYYFFYDDEISVYGYDYEEETKFENALTQYLSDYDLDNFVTTLKQTIKYYDYFEYDPEIQKAHIMYSNHGFEINIENNDPKGITLYSNYYLTDTTKQYVADGLITLRAHEDAVDKVERERRNK